MAGRKPKNKIYRTVKVPIGFKLTKERMHGLHGNAVRIWFERPEPVVIKNVSEEDI